MINIRKLAAVDMFRLGTPLIITEYALGIVLPLILGLVSIRAVVTGRTPAGWEALMGYWLVSIAANYIPLFIYAVLIAKAGTVGEEGRRELAHAKRYGLQQAIILVPFMVVIAALVQEIRGHRAK